MSNVTYHWSKTPGTILNKHTGEILFPASSGGPVFNSTQEEWNETLIEVIADIGHALGGSLEIHVSQEVHDLIMETARARFTRGGNYINDIQLFVKDEADMIVNVISNTGHHGHVRIHP